MSATRTPGPSGSVAFLHGVAVGGALATIVILLLTLASLSELPARASYGRGRALSSVRGRRAMIVQLPRKPLVVSSASERAPAAPRGAHARRYVNRRSGKARPLDPTKILDAAL